MIRIYADWNDRDEQGRLRLDIAGALRDLDTHHQALVDGLRVLLDVQHEFELEATLVFEEIWRAIPDLATIRYHS